MSPHPYALRLLPDEALLVNQARPRTILNLKPVGLRKWKEMLIHDMATEGAADRHIKFAAEIVARPYIVHVKHVDANMLNALAAGIGQTAGTRARASQR